MLKSVGLNAASRLGPSLRIAVSWPLQNGGIDRAALPRTQCFSGNGAWKGPPRYTCMKQLSQHLSSC